MANHSQEFGFGARTVRVSGIALAALAFGLGCTAEIDGTRTAAPPTPGTGAGAAAGTGTGGGSAAGAGAGVGIGGNAGNSAGGAGGTGGSAASSGTGGSGATGGASGGTGGTGSLTPDEIDAKCAALNGVLDAGLTRLRRLTRDQFNNTLRDLIQASGTPADRLNPDERIGPFNSNAISPVDNTLVLQHNEAARELATAARERMAELAPCDLDADAGTTCATQFVTEFGARAFRRPLDADEVTRYVGLYTLGKEGATAADGFRLVLEAMLQSPAFLYHGDVGSAPSSTPVPLAPYELASRLSYFLWNSMPDDTLAALAGDGTLTSASVLGEQVERLLSDDRAGATIGLFHRQWLALEDLPGKIRDTSLFPSFGPELVGAMLDETSLFSDHVIRRGDGLLSTLLTSNLAFPSGDLFEVYGITEPAGYVVGTPVELDPTRRAGILTQAAFLADNAHNDQTSPVHRGILVRENVLCQPIDSPPADANTNPPPVSQATTTRERFAQHEADPTCGGCHVLMDPIGLGFEHYDPIGAYRTQDGLSAVDATGEIFEAAADLAGPFDGAVELATKLAASGEVRACFGVQWFRFSLGRMESDADACSVKAIRDGFAASGGNIRSLMVQIAQSDAFRHVRSAE